MDRQKEYWKMWGAVAAWLLLATAMLLCGCSRKVYVPAENTTVRTDTLFRAVLRADTVIDRDTVRVTDGVTEIVRWRWRVRESRDTVYKAKTDSVHVEVPYPVEVVKEVERKRTWWETALMWIGGAAIAAAVVCYILRRG